MPEFSQQKGADTRLYAEDTDVPLPETLNPKTRYAYFSEIAKGGKARWRLSGISNAAVWPHSILTSLQ